MIENIWSMKELMEEKEQIEKKKLIWFMNIVWYDLTHKNISICFIDHTKHN